MENEEEKPDQGQKATTTEFERGEDFEGLYANNVIFESTVFDLQMIFGQLQTGHGGNPIVKQHTAITLPWSITKIVCFHMAMNIIGYEQSHGPIRLPERLLPLVTALNDNARKDPRIMSIVTALVQTANPEIFGDALSFAPSEPAGPATT